MSLTELCGRQTVTFCSCCLFLYAFISPFFPVHPLFFHLSYSTSYLLLFMMLHCVFWFSLYHRKVRFILQTPHNYLLPSASCFPSKWTHNARNPFSSSSPLTLLSQKETSDDIFSFIEVNNTIIAGFVNVSRPHYPLWQDVIDAAASLLPFSS